MRILISGTSSGIGRILARHFAERGDQVWGAARRPQNDLVEECRKLGADLRTSQCDVSNWPAVTALADEVAREWGGVDALVCCAAVQGPLGPAMSIQPDAWIESIAINLHGTFFFVRAFHDLLRRAERRSKIVCLSGGGAASPRPNFTPYAVSKAAVVRLVENLSLEWRAEKIDINAVAPGPVDTAMTDYVIALGPAVAGEQEYQAALERKKTGANAPEKFIGLISFLLSPASDGISGRLLSAVWDSWKRMPEHRADLDKSDVYTLRRILPVDRNKDWS